MAMMRIASPMGDIWLSSNGIALTRVDMSMLMTPLDANPDAILEQAALQLGEYFAGQRRAFDLPLHFPGTPFQQMAWWALTTISYGETISYREQAVRIQRPKASRAVGSANGRNPLSIIIPCHRVIAADGGLGGYGGGLDRKQWLLAHERRILQRVAA